MNIFAKLLRTAVACIYPSNMADIATVVKPTLRMQVLYYIINIIYYSWPGANTTKYNHQQDNLLVGHVQTVHGQHVCRSCRKDAQEMIYMHMYTVKGV